MAAAVTSELSAPKRNLQARCQTIGAVAFCSKFRDTYAYAPRVSHVA